MGRESARVRVLVVDDELLIRWSIAETLRAQGFEVAEAATAAEALRLVAHEPSFDAALLDYRLPDSNDLSLLANIRRLSPASAVAMLTAYGTADMESAAIGLGAGCVLSKPLDMSEIGPLVAELVRSQA